MSFRTIGIATLCLTLLFSVALYGQTNPPPSRSDRISQMSKQLHWKDGPGYDQYLRTKDAMTNQILVEVDGFITDSIQPNVTVNQVTAALDELLNHHQGTDIKSTALTADLPNGSFLIVGVDVERGGGAINDDAISFRAYRNQGGKFEFVAATNDIRSDIPGNSHLCCVYAKVLSSLPVTGEFWFIAWAMVPPQSPYTIGLRLFTLDGQQFRTLWSPPDIRTVARVENVVEVRSAGFTVESAIDSTGGAAHSPDVIIREQYALSVNGAVKITETQVNRFQ